MYKYLKTNEAVANYSEAMEAETISKNGRNSKSQMSRGNFKIFTLVILFVAGMITIKSCKKDNDNGQVSQNVVDLVSEPNVFPVAKTWARMEETVPGSERNWTVGSNTPPDGYEGIKKTSGVECFVYNTEWNCKAVKVSASENPEDFAMINPLADVLWPGNLVQGKSLESGVPTNIPVSVSKRQPGNISLAIVSSAGTIGAPMYRMVDKMQFSSVNQAMNDILRGYDGTGPARYFFEYSFKSLSAISSH